MDGQVVVAWAGVAVSLVVAAVSLAHSSKANQHSKDALALARSAEERAERLERVETESRDIAWEIVDDGDVRKLVVRNVGTDVAHDVRLVLDPENGERRSVGEHLVGAGGTVALDVRDLALEPAYLWAGFRGNVRVTWRSEAGVPGVVTWDGVELSRPALPPSGHVTSA